MSGLIVSFVGVRECTCESGVIECIRVCAFGFLKTIAATRRIRAYHTVFQTVFGQFCKQFCTRYVRHHQKVSNQIACHKVPNQSASFSLF